MTACSRAGLPNQSRDRERMRNYFRQGSRISSVYAEDQRFEQSREPDRRPNTNGQRASFQSLRIVQRNRRRFEVRRSEIMDCPPRSSNSRPNEAPEPCQLNPPLVIRGQPGQPVALKKTGAPH